MIKLKTKFISALIAFCCVFACLGVGVFAINNRLEAKAAANTYTITKLTALTNGAAANSFYAYAEEGEKPSVNSWDYVFTFVIGSGEGVKWNGEAYDGLKVKQPGNDLFFELGREAAVGDVFTIGGTFYNETADAEIIIPTTSFEWNGSTWGAAYPRHNLGKLALHGNSQPWGAAGAVHNGIYLASPAFEALPVLDWDHSFVADSAENFKINGENASFKAFKSTAAGLYIEFNRELEAGEYITVSGTFTSEYHGAKYVVEKSMFQWNGSAWEEYVDYETYELGGVVAIVDGSASNGYLQFAEGITLPVNSWDYAFMLFSGNGITVDGTPIDMTNNVKSVGNKLYVTLTPTPASVDSILSIGGTFYNEELKVKYVVDESKFVWNGSAWEEYVDYETYELGGVVAIADGSASNGYLQFADGVTLPVSSWDYAFMLFSGNGITVDGTPIDMTNNVKSVGNKLYVTLTPTSASENSILSIGGTFYNEELGVKYVVDESKFVWNGSAWEEYIEYTSHETDGLIFVQTGEGNKHVYFVNAEGSNFPIATTENDLNWTTPFSWKDGVGVTINGVAVSATVKFPGQMFIDLGVVPSENDVLVVGGTFYSKVLAHAYVIAESTFTWNGTTWVANEAETPDPEPDPEPEPDPDEYTTCEIGALTFHVNSTIGGAKGLNNQLYLQRADGNALPILSWDYLFTADTDDCFLINGEAKTPLAIKSTGDGFFWEFDALEAWDVVTISGTFTCDAKLTKYVIEESSFVWNGSSWEKYVDVEYTTYETSGLILAQTGEGNKHVYFVDAEGQDFHIATTENNLHWDTKFSWKDGVGITINGEAVSATVKFPGQMFVDLGVVPSENDVLVVGGTFYSAELAHAYVIAESTFTWNGTTWVAEGTETPDPEPDPEPPVEVEYTVYTITKIGVDNDSSDASILYIYSLGGDLLPKEKGDWDNRYTLEEGSGYGVKINGEVVEISEVKMPGDLYLVLSDLAEAGDVLELDGTFYNEAKAIKLVFEECAIEFDGENWESCVQSYDIGALILHGNSNVGEASTLNYVLYLMKPDESGLPIQNWDYVFIEDSAENFKVNGEAAMLLECKSTPDGFYFNFDALNAGDIVAISGTFFCEKLGVRYHIEESLFTWTGTGWKVGEITIDPPTPPEDVDYETYELGGVVAIADGSASNGYLQFAEGITLPVSSWDYAFMLFSGDGIKVDGNPIDMTNNVKSIGNKLYVTFTPTPASENSILSIGGTFYNAENAVKYVIEESEFKWNGTAWETTKVIEYVYHEIGAVIFSHLGVAEDNDLYLVRADGQELAVSSWKWKLKFLEGSGNGLTLNGETLATDDIKSPGSLYIGLHTVISENDVLTIGGTYLCAEEAVAYVITESSFMYNGTTWVNVIDTVKDNANAELDEYLATFNEADYYATEWDYMRLAVKTAKANIKDVFTENEIQAIVDLTKADLDSVLTRTEADAAIEQLRVEAKAELADYKKLEDYRTNEWNIITGLINEYCAKIDAATSVTDIRVNLAEAKAKIDLVKTDAIMSAEEQVVADAKAELSAYKNQADYRDKEWAEIQAILTEAGAKLDKAIGIPEEIEVIIADTKEALDAVKLRDVAEADDAFVAAAKADLNAYKSESDYYADQWNEILAIIASAGTEIDANNGNEDAINAIVANTKLALDEVLIKSEFDAYDFAQAQESAKAEIRDYYAALDHSNYTDEAEVTLSTFVAEAIESINNAQTKEEIATIVTEFKANVDGVETKVPPVESQTPAPAPAPSEGGCGSSVSGVMACLTSALAVAVVTIIRKKRED